MKKCWHVGPGCNRELRDTGLGSCLVVISSDGNTPAAVLGMKTACWQAGTNLAQALHTMGP